MVQLNPEIRRFLEEVCLRTEQYLGAETTIEVEKIIYQFKDIQQLQLGQLTSIMAVGGHLKVMFAFSFEHGLADQLMSDFTQELDFDEVNTEHYISQTIAEMINIILGNVLANFEIRGKSIILSPPVVISDAKSIYRDKNAIFISAKLYTSFGEMHVHCIGPKALFDQELNYLEAV
ncbi:MAG: chemotaxis protein CheX [Pseudomonadales bacterium]|nr:chemotaxis protein CheX [Pseudomonadales bacterium]